MRGWHIIIWLGEGNGAYKTGTEILLRGVAVSVRVTGCPFAGMGVSAWNFPLGQEFTKFLMTNLPTNAKGLTIRLSGRPLSVWTNWEFLSLTV